MKVGFIQQP